MTDYGRAIDIIKTHAGKNGVNGLLEVFEYCEENYYELPEGVRVAYTLARHGMKKLVG